MVQHGEQKTLHSERRQATGPVTVANSLKKTVLSALRQGRNVVFASFFFAVIIQEASPNPSLQHHLQSFRSSTASAQRQTGLGPRRAALPVRNPPLAAPKSGGFSACLFLGGDSGEAAKIWAPARSLVKKQTVFTFSKSNIPA